MKIKNQIIPQKRPKPSEAKRKGHISILLILNRVIPGSPGQDHDNTPANIREASVTSIPPTGCATVCVSSSVSVVIGAARQP